jgi:tyrosine-protein phosphatase SIW14
MFRKGGRCFRNLSISVVLLSTMCATSYVAQTADPNASPDRTFGMRLIIKGVPNAGEVTPSLYRGGQPSTQGFEALARMGINIVVDLRGSRESERDRVTKLGMQYAAIPWHCPFPKDDVFARFLVLIRQNPGKKIFVHCRLGDDRTGMSIAAYRMAEQGWTAEEAKREMEAFGFSLSHHLICPGLSSYEETFPERFSANPDFHSLHDPGPSAAHP